MKVKKEHRIPLSTDVLALVEMVAPDPLIASNLVFPGPGG
jgi:hypothetical protein